VGNTTGGKEKKKEKKRAKLRKKFKKIGSFFLRGSPKIEKFKKKYIYIYIYILIIIRTGTLWHNIVVTVCK
jgi:hypothetical protein